MSIDVKGQLETLAAFQATVEGVDPKTGNITARRGPSSDTFTIPPVYYGGVNDFGIFMHPNEGDTLLCVRVHPGSKGVTQAVRVLSADKAPPKEGERTLEKDDTVAIGTSPYPVIQEGEVKILSNRGSTLYFKEVPKSTQAEIQLTAPGRSGLFISDDLTDMITTISNVSQQITSGARIISGDIIRSESGSQTDIKIGHEIEAFSKISGELRGLYDGDYAKTVAMRGSPRNPVLSEYRMVVNEFSEQSAFTGWDHEHASANSAKPKEYELKSHLRAIDPRTSLSLAPHQLVEIIAGNVVDSADQVRDINYGCVYVGDANGRPNVDEMAYEADRLTSRRGLGYHFQLSTNSKSTEKSRTKHNFICAIDKGGLLKISVPKGIGAGNVLYPASGYFGHEEGTVLTTPVAKSVKTEIPVTLRDEDGTVVLPHIYDELNGINSRNTGIRFSNNSGYFQNVGIGKGGPPGGEGAGMVRVNFTAHHNMYAAAEMLIANTIDKVLIPEDPTECPGIVMGTIGSCFERNILNLDGEGELELVPLKGMSTVGIKPGKPAMYSGGGTVVAGSHSLLQYDGKNQPYTNSFVVTGTPGEFSYTGTDKGSENLKNPGGKSANINFQGAIDVSVGKDNYDQKSLVLDTAGSVIAWFGEDAAGRSLVVQTDGAVAVNVGGRGFANGASTWKQGRFDLRVNVTDKGVVGQKWSPKRAGGDNASDYIISISDAGLVIAGMKPGAPMIIRNQGNVSIESSGKLTLGGSSVEIREGNQVPRKTHKPPTAQDQVPPDPENVADTVACITDILSKMTKPKPEEEEE
jgi:hypothetical protein